MEQRQTTPFPKVTALIAGLFLRRFSNRMTSGFRRRKSTSASRAGVGRKPIGNPLGMVAIVAIFIFNSVNISGEALRTLASELGPPRDAAGRIEVSGTTYNQLRNYGRGFKPDIFNGAPISFEDLRRAGFDQNELTLGQILHQESQAGNVRSAADYAHTLAQWYDSKGLAGFVAVSQPHGPWFPHLLAWRDATLRPLLLRALGLILLILAGARHCWTLGSRNQDLGQVEWSTEWLFTLPASTRGLFGAQILGHAFVDPFAWIGTIPLLFVIYHSSGATWPVALAAGFGNASYLGLIMASLRVVSETWLRKRLAPARLKNLQALFTLVGIVLLFLLFALARSQEVAQWVVRRAGDWHGLIWNPFSIPVAAFVIPTTTLLAWEILGGAAIVFGSIYLCAFLVRDGLVATPAAYTGDRAFTNGRDLLPPGIIGKDLRLLLRDRNFFVQTLVAPALIVCFQIVCNVSMAQSIGSNFQHAATFAFAVGAYVMISTGLNVLAVEGNSLWMLYGVPVAVPTIMLRKTLLWSALGLCYACIVLALCAWHIGSFESADLSYALVALTGVLIYSFIASGIGILATDPLEVEVKRRIRPGMIYLYMILATLYGYALYAHAIWARLGQIVLSSLLAYALWQKVRDRAPYLLDAVSTPPPRVSLADGLMAALGFFVLQGVFGLWFVDMELGLGNAIVLSFAASGALVVGFTLLMFWRARVHGVLSAIGLAGPRDGRRVRSIFIGIALGVVGGGIAACYLAAIENFPALQQYRSNAQELADVKGWALPFLAVIAAPLFEEFIFRGLVFRGLRRSLPARWAITGSAAVFAICHPPLSVVPVFIMGVIAASSFEFTGWLVTPICVHMTYNGLVLLAGLLPQGRHP